MTLKSVVILCMGFLLAACRSATAPDYTMLQEELLQRQPQLHLPFDQRGSLSEAERQDDSAALGDEPLTPLAAQQFALYNSPLIRAELAQLGVAAAQRQQATLRSNPGVSLAALRPEDGGRWKIEFGISQSILDWLTMPLRERLSEEAFLEAQMSLLESLNRELRHVQRDYYAAVAARQRQLVYQELAEAAMVNADLAELLYQAGNLSELQVLRYRSEARRQQMRARQTETEAARARFALNTRLGLPARTELNLPAGLPEPAEEALDQDDLLARALQNRPDIAISRQRQSVLNHSLALERRQTRLVNAELGLEVERSTGGAIQAGPSLDFSLPLFDQGQARRASLEASIEQADAELAAIELQAQMEIAQALAELEYAREQLSVLINEDIPRHEHMLELSLLEYNFMLSGQFDLLELKQQELSSRLQAVELLLEYWQARSTLALAVGGDELAETAFPVDSPRAQPQHDHHDHSAHEHSANGHSEADHSVHGHSMDDQTGQDHSAQRQDHSAADHSGHDHPHPGHSAHHHSGNEHSGSDHSTHGHSGSNGSEHDHSEHGHAAHGHAAHDHSVHESPNQGRTDSGHAAHGHGAQEHSENDVEAATQGEPAHQHSTPSAEEHQHD